MGNPESKRPLGRPRRGCEDNIKMDLREVGCDPRDWINLAEDPSINFKQLFMPMAGLYKGGKELQGHLKAS